MHGNGQMIQFSKIWAVFGEKILTTKRRRNTRNPCAALETPMARGPLFSGMTWLPLSMLRWTIIWPHAVRQKAVKPTLRPERAKGVAMGLQKGHVR